MSISIIYLRDAQEIVWKASRASAGMAELADALDLGSSVLRRAGSSPVARTLVGTMIRGRKVYNADERFTGK